MNGFLNFVFIALLLLLAAKGKGAKLVRSKMDSTHYATYFHFLPIFPPQNNPFFLSLDPECRRAYPRTGAVCNPFGGAKSHCHCNFAIGREVSLFRWG